MKRTLSKQLRSIFPMLLKEYPNTLPKKCNFMFKLINNEKD